MAKPDGILRLTVCPDRDVVLHVRVNREDRGSVQLKKGRWYRLANFNVKKLTDRAVQDIEDFVEIYADEDAYETFLEAMKRDMGDKWQSLSPETKRIVEELSECEEGGRTTEP